MLRFVLIKGSRALISVALVVTFTFVILRLSGDPVTTLLGPDVTAEELEAFRIRHGLDRSVLEQYLLYVRNILVGDFGQSLRGGRPALELVLARIGPTLQIMVPGFLLMLAVGLPAGIHAALHRGSWLDRLTMTVSVLGYAVPNFVLGVLLILLFAVSLGWLPSSGSGSWRHALMPILTIGFSGAGVLARFVRSSMLEVLSQPYVRAAQARGLPWRRVVWEHALPNAAIPTLTVIGFIIGGLISGAVIVESVFAWPGIGRQLVTSVANRDLAVVQVCLLLIAASMVTANLLVDIAYGWLDPRIRSGRRPGGGR